MFKKLFAILLALLMLCSCVKEEPSEPIVPEEPKISETVQLSSEVFRNILMHQMSTIA